MVARCASAVPILALEWSDLDFARGQIKVQRALYEPKSGKPIVTLPKGGRPRIVPMTARLKRALADHRLLLHILRHTFCSRLAARNVPMLSIRELAGHQSLETTQRYMHLSSAAPREAIALLDRGELGETSSGAEEKCSNDA